MLVIHYMKHMLYEYTYIVVPDKALYKALWDSIGPHVFLYMFLSCFSCWNPIQKFTCLAQIHQRVALDQKSKLLNRNWWRKTWFLQTSKNPGAPYITNVNTQMNICDGCTNAPRLIVNLQLFWTHSPWALGINSASIFMY